MKESQPCPKFGSHCADRNTFARRKAKIEYPHHPYCSRPCRWICAEAGFAPGAWYIARVWRLPRARAAADLPIAGRVFRIRNEYHTQIWEPESEDPEYVEHLQQIDLLKNTDRLRDTDQLILWLGEQTADQLLLAWFIQLSRWVGFDVSRLRVVICRVERGRKWIAYGQWFLTPDEIRALVPGRQLTADEVSEIDRAWLAVTAHEPIPLLDYTTEPAPVLPAMQRALAAMLGRYPDKRSGLNMWDREMLERVAPTGSRPHTLIGEAMCAFPDHPDIAGDWYLFDRLERLSSPAIPYPFLRLNRSVARPRYRMTEIGSAALAGEANFVVLNGIDDWIGGVHFGSSAGTVWFRDGDSLVHM